MQFSTLSQALARTLAVRRLLDAERRRADGCRVRLLRLQAMLLKAQERLATLIAPATQASLPIPVAVPASPRRRLGAGLT